VADQSGRTLVELIVATACALSVALVTLVFMTSAYRWNRDDRSMLNQQRAVRNAADRIARDVRQAGAVRYTGGQLFVTRDGVTHFYRINNGRLELVDADGNVALLFQPVTGMTATVEPWTNVVRLTLESAAPDGSRFSVYQLITPRVVVP
jgi:type II secretory pathway pseudopilin PulG